jgi:hypothetical protein
MKNTNLRLLTAAAIAAVAAMPARGALVISEVLYNEVGSPTTGEWVEIFNTGPAAINLTNYKVGDEETSGTTPATGEGMYQFPAGAMIAPGQVQIVTNDADRFFTVYGFLPTYEITGTNGTIPNMTQYAVWDPDGTSIAGANGGDEVLLLDSMDSLLDAVSWGSTFAFSPSLDPDAELDGQSYERKNALVDTNTANDWQLGPTSGTAAGRSTPGTVPVPEPASLVLALAMASFGLAIHRS